MHFFGYRPSSIEDTDKSGASASAPHVGIDPRTIEQDDGARSRLVFLEAADEYRVAWDAHRIPHSFELFVDGSDTRGVIEISRRSNGSLCVVARTLPAERLPRGATPAGNGGANSVWAVRARENARWEPSAERHEVRIDLTRDSGSTWEPLFSEAPTGGAETWSITGPMAQNRRVRIRTSSK